MTLSATQLRRPPNRTGHPENVPRTFSFPRRTRPAQNDEAPASLNLRAKPGQAPGFKGLRPLFPIRKEDHYA